MPRIPDLPGYLVPFSSEHGQWLRNAVSELCQLNKKSEPLPFLPIPSGFRLTVPLCFPHALSRRTRQSDLFSPFDRWPSSSCVNNSSAQPVPWRPARQLYDN